MSEKLQPLLKTKWLKEKDTVYNIEFVSRKIYLLTPETLPENFIGAAGKTGKISHAVTTA